MKKNNVFLYVFLSIFASVVLFIIFSNVKSNLSLGASLITYNENDTKILESAKKMIMDNINKYDKEAVITVRELIQNNYLSQDEADPTTNVQYDENVRVIAKIKNKKIEDIYLSNILFKNILSCSDVCFYDSENYVAFNNSVYKIVKIDQNGYLYISDEKLVKTDRNEISNKLNEVFNSVDRSLVSNVIAATVDDITYSNVKVDKDIFVSTNSEYELYDVNSKNTNPISGNIKSYVLPIIVLKNDLTYNMGNGTKFSPYILSR